MILTLECPHCDGTGSLYRQDCGAHGLTMPCPRCLGTGAVEHDLNEECDDD